MPAKVFRPRLSRICCSLYTIRVKIALAQINPTVGDFTGNAAKLRQFSLDARQRGAELVVFPELAVCGYPPRDLVESRAFVSRSRQVLEHLAADISELAIIAGLADAGGARDRQNGDELAALLREGRIDFIQSKWLLPTYDVFDEMRNFSPGTDAESLPPWRNGHGADDLRGRLERQGVLEPPHVWPRSGGGSGARRR